MSKHITSWVDAYWHGLLTGEEHLQVDEHCEICESCQQELLEARRRRDQMREVPTMTAHESLIQNTLTKVNETEDRLSRRRGRFWKALTLATSTAAVLLLSMQIYFQTLTPNPADIQISGQQSFVAATEGSIRVRLRHALMKAPLANVPVEILLLKTGGSVMKSLAKFTTNADGSGSPRFTLPDWSEGEYTLRVKAQTEDGEDVLDHPIRLQRSWKVMLTSDKPVYQPGQTLHLRSLSLRNQSRKPVAGETVIFTVEDPKGNMLFKDKSVTSKFGIASADCLLDRELKAGTYKVNCTVGDTESALNVVVKKYVLPKFKITAVPDKSFYKPGEKVRLKVDAKYFFGKAVSDGSVAVKVRAREITHRVLQETSAALDVEGKATVELRLPTSFVGREQLQSDARVQFDLTVRDTAGQKQNLSVSRRVTTRPLKLEIIPEQAGLLRDHPNRIYFFATTADGRPAQATLRVKGHDKELTTNALGISFTDITPSTDQHELVVTAEDKLGNTVNKTLTLNRKAALMDYRVRPHKAVIKGGETLTLTGFGHGVEPVFVDLLKEGQTLITDMMDMKKGRGELKIDLPAHLAGTLEMLTYRYGPEGLPMMHKQLLFVSPASQLKIATSLDKAVYRPGEKAAITFKVSDAEGAPVAGALSLAAVDEAVFAVLKQRPGMEQIFFDLEEELLEPVATVYPWSPGVDLPPVENLPVQEPVELDARDTFNNALFSLASVDVLADSSPLNLMINSFPAKDMAAREARREGMDTVKISWLLMALSVFLITYVGVLTLEGFNVGAKIMTAVLLLFVVAPILLTPTLMKSRMSGGMENLAPFQALEMQDDAIAKGEAEWDIEENEAVDPSSEPESKDYGPGKKAQPRLRSWFPETLLWKPQLITNEQGEATLPLELADSITSWRLTASAVDGRGRLGASQTPIKVFQPFFVDLDLPVALTRLDEVSVPVVVYNYLKQPQEVELTLEGGNWFTLRDEARKVVKLEAGEVKSVSFRLRADKVGAHTFKVTALAGKVGDALEKPIAVVPNGTLKEEVINGNVVGTRQLDVVVPSEAIEGSVKTLVKIYPSGFSQLVEGMDGIFRKPYGCFEQTSSTTYPNIMALNYLRNTRTSAPAVEVKARQYIHLGYQRLLTFEVEGGGFDWYGNAPANTTLTAYGLMEFEDMAQVHDVDPRLIDRTRNWLLNQRKPDGSWDIAGQRGFLFGQGAVAKLKASAYIAWAVFRDGKMRSQVDSTLKYLTAYKADTITDTYVLALMANSVAALNKEAAAPYVKELATRRQLTSDGKSAFWKLAEGQRSTFYGAGRSGNIETTALAALAMMESDSDAALVRKSLNWLVSQKDNGGTWYSTQATVLALKALVKGTGAKLGGGQERLLELTVNGVTQKLKIAADQSEVMKMVNLSSQMKAGSNRLTLRDVAGNEPAFQVVFQHYVPHTKETQPPGPLTISLDYDRSQLRVGNTVKVKATVVNTQENDAPMVMLDLPVPAGFAPVVQDFEKMKDSGMIGKYEITPRQVIVYLRGLRSQLKYNYTYHLKAKMPVKVTAPQAHVYEYYDPDKKGSSKTSRLVVR